MQPGKRKLSAASQRAVRVRQPAYFIPELAHVVAAADERVPFVNLAQEVSATFLLIFLKITSQLKKNLRFPIYF